MSDELKVNPKLPLELAIESYLDKGNGKIMVRCVWWVGTWKRRHTGWQEFRQIKGKSATWVCSGIEEMYVGIEAAKIAITQSPGVERAPLNPKPWVHCPDCGVFLRAGHDCERTKQRQIEGRRRRWAVKRGEKP